jgi:hypothetical protein
MELCDVKKVRLGAFWGAKSGTKWPTIFVEYLNSHFYDKSFILRLQCFLV